MPSSDRRKTINSLLNSPHWGASNGGKIMSLASIDSEIFWHFHFIHFFVLSRHLLMLEIWSYHHLMRLSETNPTNYWLSFYDYWMARYLIQIYLFFLTLLVIPVSSLDNCCIEIFKAIIIVVFRNQESPKSLHWSS